LRKTILYRLFKIGGIPKKIRPDLESEGIVVSDEGIAGRVIMKNFRSRGKLFKYRMTGISGCLVITKKRVVAYAYWNCIVNVPVNDVRLSEIKKKLNGPGQIELSFESSAFTPGWKGQIIIRFNTPKAGEFYSVFNSLT
jgi:hypothetical protein